MIFLLTLLAESASQFLSHVGSGKIKKNMKQVISLCSSSTMQFELIPNAQIEQPKGLELEHIRTI